MIILWNTKKQQNITNFTSFVKLVLQHSYIINADTELVLVSLSDELCEYTKVRMRLQKPMLYNQTLKGNSLKCILISVYEQYRREGKTKNKYMEADLISRSNFRQDFYVLQFFNTYSFNKLFHNSRRKIYSKYFPIFDELRH